MDLNATQAAIRAGYSRNAANRVGTRLLSNVDIAAAIAKKQAAHLQSTDITAQQVLREIAKLSFSNVKMLFDADGNLKPIHTLTDDEAACIASLEVIKKNAEAGDGKIDTVHKVKTWDKVRSIEMLAKHFALLTERVEHGGEIVIRHELPG